MMRGMSSLLRELDSVDAQLLVDSIPALIHTGRPDGYLDYFNKPWLEYLGVTLDKVAGWNWTAFIHPEDADGIVAEWRACLATGKIFEYETRVRRANGDYRWMFHRRMPLRDTNGNIVKWYGSTLDIEERKTAEVALQNSEAYLAEAQRLSRTGSFGWKVSSGEIFWSEETFRIFQCDRKTKPTVDFILSRVHREDYDPAKQQIDRASIHGEGFDFEHRLQLPDGSVKHVRVTAHPSRDTAGNLEFVGAVTDVSQQRHAEAVIQERERDLQENTAKLEEALIAPRSACVDAQGLHVARRRIHAERAVAHSNRSIRALRTAQGVTVTCLCPGRLVQTKDLRPPFAVGPGQHH